MCSFVYLSDFLKFFFILSFFFYLFFKNFYLVLFFNFLIYLFYYNFLGKTLQNIMSFQRSHFQCIFNDYGLQRDISSNFDDKF